jgi:predicted metal-dependent enzyme (double-stranded beta helix superfamily)
MTLLDVSSPAALPTGAPARRSGGAAALAVALTLHTDLWAPLVQYRDESRWTSLIDPQDAAAVLDPGLHAELAGAQVWLLSWLPGQGTDLHDHGNSAGAFAVARGTLTERVVATRPEQPVLQGTTDLAAGRVRYFGPHHVHQVTNALTEPAVSLHVYAPALRWMNTYRVEQGALVRTGTERAGVDW